jgi:hypothetical protein
MRERQLQTCANCKDFSSCRILQNWYQKAGGKYQRYKKSADFIRNQGYDRFVEIAHQWKDSCGTLK